MARHSSLRAADADREAVTERLRQAAAEGRLEPDELEDRVHTALRARTYGELDLVLADLPGEPAPGRGARCPPPRRRWPSRPAWCSPLVVVSLMLAEAALRVTWWALLRAHGYAAARLGPQPRRPARLL